MKSKKVLLVLLTLSLALFAIIFSCSKAPVNPYLDPNNITVDIETDSQGTIFASADTAVELEAFVYLLNLANSVRIDFGDQTPDSTITIHNPSSDTLRFSHTYHSADTVTVTVMVFSGTTVKQASATVIVRPVNTKPQITVFGYRNILVTDSLQLVVMLDEVHIADSVYVATAPTGYSFTSRIFTWKPAVSDTGSHAITFVSINKKDPRLIDTEYVTIIVSTQLVAPGKPLAFGFHGVQRTGTIQPMSWNSSPLADSFYLYRKTDSASFTKIKALADTFFIDSGLSTTSTYSYYLIAKNRGGPSVSSDTVVSTYTPPIPTVTISPLDSIRSISGIFKYYADSNAVVEPKAGKYDEGTIEILGKVILIDNIR